MTLDSDVTHTAHKHNARTESSHTDKVHYTQPCADFVHKQQVDVTAHQNQQQSIFSRADPVPTFPAFSASPCETDTRLQVAHATADAGREGNNTRRS